MTRTEPLKRVFLFVALCAAASAQNYNGYPVITFSSSATTPVVSGTPVTLTWTTTCPAGTCTYELYTGDSGSKVAGSANLIVKPTKTTTYTLQVVNTPTIAVQRAVTVFVGLGTLSVTQSTSPANGGPGVPSTSPQYQAVELTYTIPEAGCTNYVPSGTKTAGCAGGSVVNPWMDVQGYCTFTGETSGSTYSPHVFYEGGANSGTGNAWKVRFSPPSAEVWDSSCLISDPRNYGTFANTALFTSVPDPLNPGPLSLYGEGNPYLLKTANGNPFYLLGVDFASVDTANNGAAGSPLITDFGFSPLPATGGLANRFNAAGVGAAQWSQSGWNFFSLADDAGAQLANCETGGGVSPAFIANGVGYRNGFTDLAGGMTLDATARVIASLRQRIEMTPERDGGVVCVNTALDVFSNAAYTFRLLEAWQYYINRWGAWVDVWNTDNERALNPAYLATLALWIKQQDPYRRALVTANNEGSNITVSSQNLDLNTPHDYIGGYMNPALYQATTVADAVAAAEAAVPGVPLIYGETGMDFDAPANEANRMQVWAGFFTRAFMTFYPGVIGSESATDAYIGSAYRIQLANWSSFVQNFDPLAMPLAVTLTGGSNKQTLAGFALGSGNDVGVYIVNKTNRITVSQATVEFAVPSASMACSWIAPSTGVVLGTFTTGATAGTQTFTMPNWGNGNQYGDLLLRCRATTNPVVTTVTAPAVLVGASYSLTLTAAGGAGSPYSWAIVAGALPHGMSLNGSTGVICGTPDTAMVWNFVVQATDSGGTQSTAQKLIVTVYPEITVPMTLFDNGTLGREFNPYHPMPVNVSGGVQPVGCTLTGTAPSGISMMPNCVLAGTPESSGKFSFEATATDAVGNTATSTLSLTIPSTITTIETAAVPKATAGYFYQAMIQSRGGTGTVTWTVSSGSLCPGLSLASYPNGQALVSGRVSGEGGCTFSLTATDSIAGASAAQSYMLIVNPAPSVTTLSLPAATVGVPYYLQVGVSGGTLPNWCNITAGILPTGIYLDPENCELYGTSTTAGSFPFTISAWDAWNAEGSVSYTFESMN